MSFVKRITIDVTTASDGSATARSAERITGLLSSIQYVKTDFADGSTITITSDETGEQLWSEANVNASTVRRPRAATHSTAGAAALFAAGGAAVLEKIALAEDRIKIVIASGGNTKTGRFVLVFE